MERTAVAARLQFGVRTPRVLEGALLGHQDEGMQSTVARGDACQRVACQCFRGDGAGPKSATHFGDGEVLGVHHLSPRRKTFDGSASGP